MYGCSEAANFEFKTFDVKEDAEGLEIKGSNREDRNLSTLLVGSVIWNSSKIINILYKKNKIENKVLQYF